MGAVQYQSGDTSKPQKLKWNVADVAPDNFVGDLGVNNKSEPIHLGQRQASLELALTGTPTGTVTLFVSDSHDPSSNHVDKWNGTWTSINARISPAIVQPAGAGTSYFISLIDIRARYLYVDYARSAGDGTIVGFYGVEPLA